MLSGSLWTLLHFRFSCENWDWVGFWLHLCPWPIASQLGFRNVWIEGLLHPVDQHKLHFRTQTEREKKQHSGSRAASPVPFLATNECEDDQEQSYDPQWCQDLQDQPISCQDRKRDEYDTVLLLIFIYIFSITRIYSHTVSFQCNWGSGTRVLACWGVGLDSELIGACRVTFHSVGSGLWVCYVGFSKKNTEVRHWFDETPHLGRS